MLLLTTHPLIKVDFKGEEVEVRFGQKRWLFPREDCQLLPVTNTTAEELAYWLASRMRDVLKPIIGDRLSSIEIGVDENNGQWGYCRLPW